MDNKIIVFKENRGDLSETLEEYMDVKRFELPRRKADDPIMSSAELILYYLGGFIDEARVDADNGEWSPIFLPDIIGRLDEETDIKPYFEELLKIGRRVFYFAEHKSSIDRLKGLPARVFSEGVN